MMRIETERMRPGYIKEYWPTIGADTIHVVIPPDFRRPWPDERPWWNEMPDSAGHPHPFGMTWPQDALKESSRV
jgi:hypothetical protein